uniref:Sulfotransferase n=1 Tax=Oryza punctata TaxID=4537 RepID=A0A0E0LA20_ORYPU
MASDKPSAPVGPVPFKDVGSEMDTALPEQPPEKLSHLADMVSSLPSKMEVNLGVRVYCYQGFWLPDNWVVAAIAMQRGFKARPDDVIVASLPKCGTTWLNALAFATMARHTYPPAAASHPLRRLNPHQCLPFLEGLFATGQEAMLDTLPSPRLMNTHMPLTMLPNTVLTTAAATEGGGCSGCRVIYICREPKDIVVSFWHYFQQSVPSVTLAETFEAFCDGAKIFGPFWDHILNYWRASTACPDNVLFLRYEELLRDPTSNVRKLAQFVGLPFSDAEEEVGVVDTIVKLCSLDNLRSLETNRTGYVDKRMNLRRETLFRKGIAGDWINHITPEMARRLDDIVAQKLGTMGLIFK